MFIFLQTENVLKNTLKHTKYNLINKNLTETVKKIKSILEAERIINQKQTLILKKVRSL